MAVLIGMAKQELSSAKDPAKWTLSDEQVCVVALYAQSEETKTIWLVLDFMDFNLKVVNTLKSAVATAVGLVPEQVHILTTHNHGAGEDHALEKLSPLCATCALKAVASARPASMTMAITDVDKQVNYIRRMYIPEIEASTTLFYGTCEENNYDSAPHTEGVLQELAAGRLSYRALAETNRPYKPFPNGDTCLFAAVFRDVETNQVIGSLVRFAAHAICTYTGGILSSDFPHHIRTEMEEILGGTSMFINGPCGNIAPGFKNRNGLAQRLGHYLTQTALDALKDQPQIPLTKLQDTALTVSLPVSPDVLSQQVDMPDEMPEDLSARLRYLEAKDRVATMEFLREKYCEGETTLKDTTDVSVGILQLNDLTLVGFPGETFYETGNAIRKAFPDKKIVTATEHGRTVMYLPVKEEVFLGGYETVCRVTAPGAAEVMEEAVKAALKQKL